MRKWIARVVAACLIGWAIAPSFAGDRDMAAFLLKHGRDAVSKGEYEDGLGKLERARAEDLSLIEATGRRRPQRSLTRAVSWAGEASMGNSHLATAIGTAVLVAGGIAVGAALFGGDSVEQGDTADTARAAPPPSGTRPPTLQPGTGGDDERRLERRLATLENEVRVLRAALDQAGESTKPLVELYEKFKAAGGIPVLAGEAGAEEVAPGAAREFVGEPMGGAALARYLGKKAGLDAKRAGAMAQEYERIAKDIERLEKENAKVAREGDTTTITIGRYASEGSRLRRRWDDWLEANLTREEQDRFATEGGTNKLMGARLGDWSRTITIQEAGGSIKLNERSEHASGAKVENNTEGPALARDVVLDGYLHLLR